MFRHSLPFLFMRPHQGFRDIFCRGFGHALRQFIHQTDVAVVAGALSLLEVSPKVAAKLIQEYRTLFHVRQLGDNVFSISCGGDPARAYDRYMRQILLLQLMEEVLKPRELNLVRSYLGIGQPGGGRLWALRDAPDHLAGRKRRNGLVPWQEQKIADTRFLF